MEIKWTDVPCEPHEPITVHRRGVIDDNRVVVMMLGRGKWGGTFTQWAPYTLLTVSRATEAEALADVLDLARRCGMVAE